MYSFKAYLILFLALFSISICTIQNVYAGEKIQVTCTDPKQPGPFSFVFDTDGGKQNIRDYSRNPLGEKIGEAKVIYDKNTKVLMFSMKDGKKTETFIIKLDSGTLIENWKLRPKTHCKYTKLVKKVKKISALNTVSNINYRLHCIEIDKTPAMIFFKNIGNKIFYSLPKQNIKQLPVEDFNYNKQKNTVSFKGIQGKKTYKVLLDLKNRKSIVNGKESDDMKCHKITDINKMDALLSHPTSVRKVEVTCVEREVIYNRFQFYTNIKNQDIRMYKHNITNLNGSYILENFIFKKGIITFKVIFKVKKNKKTYTYKIKNGDYLNINSKKEDPFCSFTDLGKVSYTEKNKILSQLSVKSDKNVEKINEIACVTTPAKNTFSTFIYPFDPLTDKNKIFLRFIFDSNNPSYKMEKSESGGRLKILVNGKVFFTNNYIHSYMQEIYFDINQNSIITKFEIFKRKNFYDLSSPEEGYCDIRKVAAPMIKARTADGKKVLLRSDNMTWKFDK